MGLVGCGLLAMGALFAFQKPFRVYPSMEAYDNIPLPPDWQEKAEWDFDAYVNEGRYEDRAIQDYEQVIRLAPNTRAAFNNRGNVYVSKRQYERALADFEQAMRLAPDDAMYYRNRGNVFRLMGQYDRAIADYRKALSLKADAPTRKFVEAALKELGVAS